MLVSEMITQCNSLVDDTFQPADWIAWFQDAIKDLRPHLRITKTQVVNITPEQTSYTLPADCRLPLYVIVGTTTYPKLAIDDFTSAGAKFDGTTFTIQPAVNTATLARLVYNKNAALPSIAGDTLDVPDDVLPMVKLYACHCSQQKDEEPERVTDFYAEYTTKLKAYIAEVKLMAQDVSSQLNSWVVFR